MNQVKALMILLCIFNFLIVSAQKKTITSKDYGDWQKMTDYNVSDDGEFAWYSWEFNPNQEFIRKDYGVVLRSTDGLCEWKFRATDPVFVGHKLILRKSTDSVTIFDFRRKTTLYLSDVKNYKIVENDSGNYLIYSTSNHLIFLDLATESYFSYPPVKEFFVTGKAFTVATLDLNGDLQLITPTSKYTKRIMKCKEILKLITNGDKSAFAFLDTNFEGRKGIYYYSFRTGLINKLIDENILRNESKAIDDLLEFTPDGRQIYFKIKLAPKIADAQNEIKIVEPRIWNYKDVKLSGEGNLLKTSFISVISVKKPAYKQLETDSTEINGPLNLNSSYVLLKRIVNEKISYWNRLQQTKFYLLNINSGKKVYFLPSDMHIMYSFAVGFSSNGKFINWQDKETGEFSSYELQTGKVFTNSLQSVHDNLRTEKRYVCGWLPHDSAYLLTNDSTLWQVDPRNKEKVLNLTSKLNSINGLRINVVDDNLNLKTQKILLNVFDSDNRNGFAVIEFGKRSTLNLGSLSSCIYGGLSGIKKAKNVSVYVMSHETENSAPNLCVTSDFVKYKSLSCIHPEKKYNWLSSELIRWKMYDGRIGKGILYKPENFDSTKSYPVIFNFYQERNRELHKFWNIGNETELGSNISIPEYVSNGYIVCIPDILNDLPGQIAFSTINAVESCTKFIIDKYPWVNKAKIGLQGHSFGGYETNILVSNSVMYTAACSSHGISDLISFRGQSAFGQMSMDYFTEVGQINMGFNNLPWSATLSYINNSPIFRANNVRTPLLLKHASDDSAVPPLQSIEWFTALRRLGKPVWYLEYREGGHVMGGASAFDFSLRQRQFFDHYLMGKPAPSWMSKSN